MSLSHFACILEIVIPVSCGKLAACQEIALKSQNAPSGVNLVNQTAHCFSAL